MEYLIIVLVCMIPIIFFLSIGLRHDLNSCKIPRPTRLPTIVVKNIVKDIKDGLSDNDIMSKYEITDLDLYIVKRHVMGYVPSKIRHLIAHYDCDCLLCRCGNKK